MKNILLLTGLFLPILLSNVAQALRTFISFRHCRVECKRGRMLAA
jgi:hypothetical protein